MQTQTAKKSGTWTRTRLKNLLRHKSGRYYARAFVGGKEVWQSLGTAHFSVAESKLQKFLEQYRSVRRRGATIASAKMTFGEAGRIHAGKLERNVKIKQRTRDYWDETLKALYKSWPELPDTQLRNIRQTDLEKWAGDYAKTASATRYNNTVHLLRHVLNVGGTDGVLAHNVATALHRISVKPKEPALPSLAQFNSLIHEMREGHGRFSKACADLAAGLAFTGCRLGEARSLTWGDIDFDLGRIVIRGNPETGTKNREIRRFRLLPDAQILFERMRANFADDGAADRVFRVVNARRRLIARLKRSA